MSKKQQDAAIQKWFSYIKDSKKRGDEISRTREQIASGIISYPEWVKATLLINRIEQVNGKDASIELLRSLNGSIGPKNGNHPDQVESFIASLLSYYVGKHSKEDVNAFLPECKPEKSVKSEKPLKKKKGDTSKEKSFSKFFGNW